MFGCYLAHCTLEQLLAFVNTHPCCAYKTMAPSLPGQKRQSAQETIVYIRRTSICRHYYYYAVYTHREVQSLLHLHTLTERTSRLGSSIGVFVSIEPKQLAVVQCSGECMYCTGLVCWWRRLETGTCMRECAPFYIPDIGKNSMPFMWPRLEMR